MSLEANFYSIYPDNIQKIDLHTTKFNRNDCSDLLAWKVIKLLNSNKNIADQITSENETIKFRVTSSHIVFKKSQENEKIISNPELAKEWMEAVKTTITVINPVVESFSFVVDNNRKEFIKKEKEDGSFFKDDSKSQTKEALKRINQETGKRGNFAELNQTGHLCRHGAHFFSHSFHAEFPHFFGH